MINLKITGLNEVLGKLAAIGPDIQEDVNAEVTVLAYEVAADAIANAPTNLGALKQGIKSTKAAKGYSQVYATPFYSPYVEFGTGGKTVIPTYMNIEGLDAFAAQFKGQKHGDYSDFLNAILDWVHSKGLVATYSVKTQRRQKKDKGYDERLVQLAELIAWSILRNGIRPQPFFFPALSKGAGKLVPLLQNILKGYQ